MTQYGFYFDMTRCIGCRTCQVACKDRLGLTTYGPRPRRVSTFECGSYPETGLFHTSIGCNHCESPACVANCPTGAMCKGEDGIVLHNDEACIQCQTCMRSCPYEAPQLDEIGNQIIKCDSCKALREGGLNPVCVDSCPTRALDFGDMDELKAKYGNDLVSEAASLPSAAETTPGLLIKLSKAGSSADCRELLI